MQKSQGTSFGMTTVCERCRQAPVHDIVARQNCFTVRSTNEWQDQGTDECSTVVRAADSDCCNLRGNDFSFKMSADISQ